MTAAVRPARESAPQRVMMSAAALIAPLPESGRSRSSREVSSGMPKRRSAGASSRARTAGSGEARSRYIAEKSTISAGSISRTVQRPFFAPAVMASMTSTFFISAHRHTHAMMSAGARDKSALTATAS